MGPPPGLAPAQAGRYYVRPKQTPETAVISLVLGVVSLLACGFITAIPGLIVGYSAKKKIDSRPDYYGGRGLAIAGIALGWTVLGISVVAVGVVIVLGLAGALG